MKKLFKKIMNKIQSRFYDEYSIVELFRKQGAIIGDNCRIASKFLAGEPYLVKLGNHVAIAGNVMLVTHDGAVWVNRHNDLTMNRFGTIEIKDNSFIGYGAIIMPNVKIGPNSIVGAGSVVRGDVPENCVVAGNPARFVCKTEEYIEMCKKETIIPTPEIRSKIKTGKDAHNFHILFKDMLLEKYKDWRK